ncbi:Holliday junction resolvase RuvX [Marisediminicola sp. LYQ134]|uniref:Holliday junction resolvase RuvX n=1 Tax=unclassified Marisediminicola TaxID=2618316 RepID=UPI0039834471
MRSGVRLGVDVGTTRIGVARSDLHGMLALPVETVARGTGDIATILAHAAELEVTEIVVGLPIALSGNDTASTADARAFALALALAAPAIDVRLVDERLSTVSAHQALRGAGRTAKNSRSIVDQVAAVIILQHALDHERSSGRAPGTVVTPDEGM